LCSSRDRGRAGCARDGFPGVYTRTTEFLEFIKEKSGVDYQGSEKPLGECFDEIDNFRDILSSETTTLKPTTTTEKVTSTQAPTTTTTQKLTTTTSKPTTTTEKTTTKAPPKEPECAKGLDCDPGHTCNKNKECVANEGTKCGSKRDCLEFGKPNCVEGACVASVPALNDYGNEYGRIFYETSCTLQTDSTREAGPWEFVCEYQYEADAIVHNIVDEEEEEEEANGDDASYDAEYDYTNIECKLLNLQFRDFQVETVKLEALEKEGLKVSQCIIEDSVIPTPEPPAPTQPVPEVTTEVDAPGTPSTPEPPATTKSTTESATKKSTSK